MENEGSSANGLDLSPNQIAAIQATKKFGAEIAKNYPEIADDYANGMTAKAIAVKYGFDQMGHKLSIARGAVAYALRELLPEEKRKEYAEGNLKRSRQNIGQLAHQTGRAIFAITPEQRESRGRELYENRGGVHGRSQEERKDYAKDALAARGLVPWHNNSFEIQTRLDEFHYCLKLLADQDFKHMHKGQMLLDRKKIANELNVIFHRGQVIRTPNSITDLIGDLKKKGKKKKTD